MKSVVKRAVKQKIMDEEGRRKEIVKRTRVQQSPKSNNEPVSGTPSESGTLENVRKVGEDYKKIKGVDLTPEQENELWDIFKDAGDDGEKLRDWFDKNFPEYISQKVELQFSNEITAEESK